MVDTYWINIRDGKTIARIDIYTGNFVTYDHIGKGSGGGCLYKDFIQLYKPIKNDKLLRLIVNKRRWRSQGFL